jgi:YD repeat-containing protein
MALRMRNHDYGGSATTLASSSYDDGMRTGTRVLGNGLTTTFAYRGAPGTAGDNQLASLTVETSPGANDRRSLSYTYGYDQNKNPTAENRGTAGSAADDYSFATTYDAKDRLTQWLRDNGDNQNWNLSLVGDWNTTDGSIATSGGGFDQSRTHNDVHEIVTLDPDNTGGASPIALTHDAKGNLTQDATSGGGMVLSYDFDNQLRQAVVPSGASRGLVGTHTYRYDALGRRVAKVVDTNADNTPDTTTVFIYNARWQFIAEYSGGAAPASPTRSRVYSAGYIDEPLAQIEHSGAQAGTYYLHRDKQYCLIGLTNASGTIVETYTYTPYGQRIVRDASFANPSRPPGPDAR